jgi:hypothetical protein
VGATTLGIPYPDSTDNYRPKEDMQALAEEVDDLITAAPGVWANYVPVWSSSGTAPAIGNGTISGRWVQIGKTVYVKISLLFGTTTTFGTGGYSLSLPAAASTSVGSVGAGYLNDVSAGGGGHYNGIAVVRTVAPTVALILESSSHAQVSAVGPITWANTDAWTFSLTYEVP